MANRKSASLSSSSHHDTKDGYPNKKKNRKLTPCSIINDFRKEIVRRHSLNSWFDGGSSRSNNGSRHHRQPYNNSTGDELLRLCYQRTDHKNTPDFVYVKIRDLLKRHPSIIHHVDHDNGNYNCLHYICSNPTLTNNLRLIKFVINASETVQGKKTKKKHWNSILELHNEDNDDAGGNDDDDLLSVTSFYPIPSTDQLVRQRTMGHGKLPLHLLCQNAGTTTVDVLDYLVQCDPASVCTTDDTLQKNLPIHYLSISCTEQEVPLEMMILLVQQWPESCRMANHEGNLPLHLAAHIIRSYAGGTGLFHNTFQDIDTMEDLRFHHTGDDDDHDEDTDHKSVTTNTSATRGSNGSYAIPLPSSSYHNIEKERKVYEFLERSRYEKQLDIVVYLVEVYPEAMSIKNHDGLTPLQVAMATAAKSLSLSTSSSSPLRSGSNHACQHPIVDYLNDVKCGDDNDDTTNNDVDDDVDASFAGDDDDDDHHHHHNRRRGSSTKPNALSKEEAKRELYDRFGIHDVSGREIDDDEAAFNPWSSDHQPNHIDTTKRLPTRRNSTDGIMTTSNIRRRNSGNNGKLTTNSFHNMRRIASAENVKERRRHSTDGIITMMTKKTTSIAAATTTTTTNDQKNKPSHRSVQKIAPDFDHDDHDDNKKHLVKKKSNRSINGSNTNEHHDDNNNNTDNHHNNDDDTTKRLLVKKKSNRSISSSATSTASSKRSTKKKKRIKNPIRKPEELQLFEF